MNSKTDRFIRPLTEEQLDLAHYKLTHDAPFDGIPGDKNYQDAVALALFNQNRQTLKRQAILPGRSITTTPSKRRRPFSTSIERCAALSGSLDDFYTNILTFLSINNPHVVVACMNTLYLINSTKLRATHYFEIQSIPYKAICNMPSSEDCVATIDKRHLAVFDTAAGRSISKTPIDSGQKHNLYAHDDSSIFTSTDCVLSRYDTRNNHSDYLFSSNSSILGLTGQNNWLCTSSYTGEVLLFDTRYMANPVVSFVGHGNSLKAISFSPFNSDLIATAGGIDDRQIIIWSISQQKSLMTLATDQQFCNIHFAAPDLIFGNGRNGDYGVVSTYQISKHNGKAALKERTSQIFDSRVTYSAKTPDNPHRFFCISDSRLHDVHIKQDQEHQQQQNTPKRSDALRTIR